MYDVDVQFVYITLYMKCRSNINKSLSTHDF